MPGPGSLRGTDRAGQGEKPALLRGRGGPEGAVESLGRAWQRCGGRSPGSAQGVPRWSWCAAGPGTAAAQPDVSGRAESSVLAGDTRGICHCSDTVAGFVCWSETALRQAGLIFRNWCRFLCPLKGMSVNLPKVWPMVQHLGKRWFPSQRLHGAGHQVLYRHLGL